MSDLATRPPGDLARTDEPKNPLRQLPKDWRQPVAFFYACHSDILKGTLSLVSKVRFWMKEDGLTLDELKAALRLLMDPEVCAEINYVGQLHARLAQAVTDAMHRRKRDERTAEQRAKLERPKGVADTISNLADAFARRVTVTCEGIDGTRQQVPAGEAPGF